MTAARVGRTFSGFVTCISPPGKDSFTGRFTASDALEATVRVRRGTGAERCDTWPIEFVAHRVGRKRPAARLRPPLGPPGPA